MNFSFFWFGVSLVRIFFWLKTKFSWSWQCVAGRGKRFYFIFNYFFFTQLISIKLFLNKSLYIYKFCFLLYYFFKATKNREITTTLPKKMYKFNFGFYLLKSFWRKSAQINFKHIFLQK